MKLIKKFTNSMIENEEFIYLCGLAVSLFTMLMSQTVLTSRVIYGQPAATMYEVLRNVRYFTYIVFMLIIFIDFVMGRVNRWLTVITMAVAGVSFLLSKDFQIFSYAIITVAAAKTDIRKVMKIYLWEIAVLTLAVVTLTSVDILYNYIDSPATRYRQSLGFTWTTTPATFWFSIMCIGSYLSLDKKFDRIHMALIFFVTVLLYMVTDSRGYYMVQILFFILICLYLRKEDILDKILNVKVIKWICVLSPFISCGFISVVSYIYNRDSIILNTIDSLLSNRLTYAKKALDEFGVSIFGQYVKWVGNSAGYRVSGRVYNYVDTSYLRIAINYGVVILLMVLLGYALLIKRSIEKKRYNETIIYLMLMLLSLTESRLINVIFTPFLICMSQFFNSKDVAGKESGKNEIKV